MVGQADERSEPFYDLGLVKKAFSDGRFRLTYRVLVHLGRHGWSVDTVRACTCALARTDFHKSQRHRLRQAVWLDIYRPVFRGSRHYEKFTLLEDEERFLVLSFCLDGEDH